MEKENVKGQARTLLFVGIINHSIIHLEPTAVGARSVEVVEERECCYT